MQNAIAEPSTTDAEKFASLCNKRKQQLDRMRHISFVAIGSIYALLSAPDDWFNASNITLLFTGTAVTHKLNVILHAALTKFARVDRQEKYIITQYRNAYPTPETWETLRECSLSDLPYSSPTLDEQR